MEEYQSFILGLGLFLVGIISFAFSLDISEKTKNNLPFYASLAIIVIGGTIALVTILF